MQSRLVFIIATVAIDAMGIGLILPVMPDLIRALSGGTLSEAAFWGGILAFTYAAIQFLVGPLLGNLSDAYGRRPVLLASLFFMGLDYLLMAAAGSLWLLVLARAISGATGATYGTATAYLADISTREERAKRFGLVGAAFGIGFVAGPAIGGLLGELGPRAPFLAAAVLALGNAAFGWWRLPETLTPERRRPFALAGTNPLSAIRKIGAIPALGALVLVHFCIVLSNNVYPAVWAFFTAERFGWSAGLIGGSLAIYGISAAIVQGVLIRPVLRRLGEARTVVITLWITILALLGFAFAPSSIFVLVLIPISALGIMEGAALGAIIANRVEDNRQGELQGVLGSVQSLAAITAPITMNGLFRLFTGPDAPYFPGAPFLAAALLTFGALLLFHRISIDGKA